ncbi:MAG: hypothetical protein EP344_12390 [Bacteroidetes bacterium]|nr:MAG: hypothetical protein EP344_12390 [Bacteroidota bacterium]
MKHLLLLFLFSTTLLNGQNTDVWGHLVEGHGMISFLSDCSTKPITPAVANEIARNLTSIGLQPSTDTSVLIGNSTLRVEPAPNIHLYKSKDRLTSLYIEEPSNKADLNSRWTLFRNWRGVYSGYNHNLSAFYYLKLDSLFNVSINGTLVTDKQIVNVQQRLPFYSTDINEISEEQWQQIDEANARLLKTIHILCTHLIYEKDRIYLPSNGRLYHRVFTPTERLTGFINFWTEVKYNFAFFDQVPALDWDNVLAEYLPRIQAEQSNAEYYKLMEEVCALLNDGHTNVYLPADLKSDNYHPRVKLGNFEDRIYVLNTSEKFRDVLPVGSEIVGVNGEKISSYLYYNLFPYISASTQYIKQKNAIRKLLNIPKGQTLNIAFVHPEGTPGIYTFSFETDTTSWIISDPGWHPVEFKILENNTAFLKINTFERAEVVGEFLKVKDAISKSSKLIIDLRDNGGGNSAYGQEILKYFAPGPFLSSSWRTREHKAAFKAWGKYADDPPADPFEEECLLTFKGNYWHIAPPDTIEPYFDQFISIPVVILIGNNTASAAEDFLVSAESIGITETVGDLTFGSTGQPLHFKLPGGGSARVCTKKDTYPDGREFVGYGIKPKYLVKPGLQDVLKQRDVVLEFALELK